MPHPDDPNFPPPHDPLDGDDASSSGSGREERVGGFVTELVRKMAVAGMGALFMGEEGIRNLAGQLKLPKELLGFILSQAEKTKDDIGRVVSEELRRFLQSEKLREEALKLLSGMTVEIKAEVRLVPDKRKGRGASAASGASPGHAQEDSEPTDSGRARLEVSELSARRARKHRKE